MARQRWPVSRRLAALQGVITIVCLLALVCASPALAGGRVPRDFVGVVVGSPLSPATVPSATLASQFDAMVASGVESIRVVFDWSYAQPYRSWRQVPPGEAGEFTNIGGVPTRFDQTDEIVGLAAERGITVLAQIIYTPAWDAAPAPNGALATPQRVAPYASYAAALVARYGPRGTFWAGQSPKVPIRMWQVWNEPNIKPFWPKQPFQQSYVRLLRASHNAIKRADPGAKVVLAGMPNYSWQSLRGIYKVRDARGLFDVVAVHPYTRQPQGVITILKLVRQVMDQAGDERKPIVADELSWPSSQGKTIHNEGYDFGTTEAGQARKLAALLPMLGENRQRLRLLGFYWYDWVGAEDPAGVLWGFSGLERFSSDRFVAKPALSAFRRGALALEACRRKGSLATNCLRSS
jgi:arabinogalactan endo-1,4-beta-galactosidase